MLFVVIAFWATWFLYAKSLAVDFLSYWAASHLVLGGHPELAYNLQAHHVAEMLVRPIDGLLPFAYPPPFLLIVTPLAIAPYWLAFGAWLAITGTLYALVVGRKGMLPFAMGHPSVLANFLIGQNGLLTTSIMAAGLRLVDRKPFAGGAVLGMMVIKPQLALVLPFAMLAGRRWAAIAGAMLSASVLLVLAWLAFGWKSYVGFVNMLPVFSHFLEQSQWPWGELASVFACLRFVGVQQTPAFAAQWVVAATAVAFVCRAWWLGLEERAPMTAAATLLVPPYLLTYDAVLLVIPMIWLIERQRSLGVVLVSTLLCLLPIAYYFGFYRGPNTIPLAAILCMAALHVRPKAGAAKDDLPRDVTDYALVDTRQ